MIKMEENVVKRLRNRLTDAKTLGFKVRLEPLEDQMATWCEIAGIPTLFVDLSQPAAEQLQQVNDALDSFRQEKRRQSIAMRTGNQVATAQ